MLVDWYLYNIQEAITVLHGNYNKGVTTIKKRATEEYSMCGSTRMGLPSSPLVERIWVLYDMRHGHDVGGHISSRCQDSLQEGYRPLKLYILY